LCAECTLSGCQLPWALRPARPGPVRPPSPGRPPPSGRREARGPHGGLPRRRPRDRAGCRGGGRHVRHRAHRLTRAASPPVRGDRRPQLRPGRSGAEDRPPEPRGAPRGGPARAHRRAARGPRPRHVPEGRGGGGVREAPRRGPGGGRVADAPGAPGPGEDDIGGGGGGGPAPGGAAPGGAPAGGAVAARARGPGGGGGRDRPRRAPGRGPRRPAFGAAPPRWRGGTRG